ncbi:hypothetical protein F4604DRAFT_1504133, partial [Suillus subluteus]
TNYPDVEKEIIHRLESLQEVGAMLTLVTIHAIVLAMVSEKAPKILEQKAKDGSTFQCSDSFLQNWLHTILHWSEHRATQAAQKISSNWEDMCKNTFLHWAYMIKE